MCYSLQHYNGNSFMLHEKSKGWFTVATESDAQGALPSSVNQKEESEAESEARRNRSQKDKKSFFFFRFRFRFHRFRHFRSSENKSTHFLPRNETFYIGNKQNLAQFCNRPLF